METDRAAVLTVRAAVRGVIDFSKARLLDPAWWQQTNTLIRSVGRADDMEAAKTALSLQLALIGNGNLDESSFSRSQTRAGELVRDVLSLIWPWHGNDEKSRKQMAESLADLYRRTIGDPRDPVFMAKLKADWDAAEARRLAGTPETDEQRVDRLLAERTRSP